MKKSIIAAGAASLAVAAMPVVGVFATDDLGPIVDNIQVTIDSACSVTATNSVNDYSVNMTNSQLKSDIGSTTMTVKCNDAKGWQLNAVGSGPAVDKTVLQAAAPSGSTSVGTDIATGTATSGATSNWAMKVTSDKAIAPFTGFASVPSSATPVAKDTVPTNNPDATTGLDKGVSVQTTYQVWISASQQAGTYTGQVTYTLVHPAATI